jgi:UDPglucose 6-dehydrogenase
VLKGKKIGVLGLAFKGGTDDIRESPALRIVKLLLEEGAWLQVHDPQAMEASRQEIPPQAGRLEYCSSPYEAAREAHVLLILTEWQEYRELDFTRLNELMEVPVIIDGRNLLDPDVVRRSGFEYVDVGRIPLSPDVAPPAESESVDTGGNRNAEQPVTTVENAS